MCRIREAAPKWAAFLLIEYEAPYESQANVFIIEACPV